MSGGWIKPKRAKKRHSYPRETSAFTLCGKFFVATVGELDPGRSPALFDDCEKCLRLLDELERRAR